MCWRFMLYDKIDRVMAISNFALLFDLVTYFHDLLICPDIGNLSTYKIEIAKQTSFALETMPSTDR